MLSKKSTRNKGYFFPWAQSQRRKKWQKPAPGQQKDKQTGIPSPDSLSQAMPPWLTGFYF